MQIAFHIGAHCTDDERLLKSLLRNRDRLSEAGIAVPGPSKYRRTLRDVVNGLRGEPASLEAQDIILETILEGDDPRRLVLGNPSFVSVPNMALADGQLYPKAWKAEWLRNIFPNHEVSFNIAVRNPATFVPALYEMAAKDDADFLTFLDGADPRALRWSAPIKQIAQTCPGCPINVWCYEDSPMIWEEIMRAVSGAGPDVRLHGGFDMARTILSEEGMRRLRTYTRDHPPETPALKRRVLAVFVEKFGLEDELVEVLDLPGWNDTLIDELTAIYEEDLAGLASIPNVRTVAP